MAVGKLKILIHGNLFGILRKEGYSAEIATDIAELGELKFKLGSEPRFVQSLNEQDMKRIGGVTGLLAKLIAWGNGAVCLLMGRGIYMVQYGMKELFLKLSRKEDV